MPDAPPRSTHVAHVSSHSDASPNASAPVPPPPSQDCRACKLVGGGAFSGLGVYALVLAQRQGAFRRVRPPGGSGLGSRVQAVLGVGACEVGPKGARGSDVLTKDVAGLIAAGIGRLLM